MPNEVILYDLPCRGRNHCWSLNPWKTRLALNYKGIPYKTSWLEYPDIKPTLSKLGIAGNDMSSGSSYSEYSIPSVTLPDGRNVMDSRAIANELETLQPQPSLRLDNGYVDRVQQAVLKIVLALAPEVMPKIPANILNEASVGYFRETRAKRFGMPLEELAKSDRAGAAAWKNAETPMEELRDVLLEHPEGPFVEGKQESYADFVIAGFFRFAWEADPKVFERGIKFHPSFQEHYDACQKWLAKDD